MIAIDTNILVRFLTADDKKQHQKSVHLFKNYEIFIPKTVLLETAWVLAYSYDFKTNLIMESFKKLIQIESVIVEDAKTILQAIGWSLQDKLDFADALHLASSQHCESLYTFDQKYIKYSKTLGCTDVSAP